MRILVCEFPNEAHLHKDAIARITMQAELHRPDLIFLPEMPLTSWIFDQDVVDTEMWDRAVSAHEAYLTTWPKALGVPVLTTRPTEGQGGARLNQAVLADAEVQPLRAKQYLPNEADGRERDWFEEGTRLGSVHEYGDMIFGVQICSETVLTEYARSFARAGAHLIFQPRATGAAKRWLISSTASAVNSGCYVVSCNRRSADGTFAGGSIAVDPEGEIIACTSAEMPAVCVDIDLGRAEAAKQGYPHTLYEHYAL